MGQLQSNPVRRTTFLLLIVCGATFFAGLGRPAIGDSDEAFYAEAGREMVGSGDWITPVLQLRDTLSKADPLLLGCLDWLPPRGGQRGRGPGGVGAGRAGVGVLTAACGRRWYDERTGRLAGLVVATAFGYFSIGRLALPDLPLAFWITLTTWAAIVGLCDEPARPGRWLMLAGAAVGLGFLTEGTGGDRRAGARRRSDLLARTSPRPPGGPRDRRSGDRCRRDCRSLVRRDGADPRQSLHRRLLRRRQPRAVCHQPASTTRGLPGSTCRSSRAACCPGRR